MRSVGKELRLWEWKVIFVKLWPLAKQLALPIAYTVNKYLQLVFLSIVLLWHAPFGCIYFLLLFGPSFHLVFGEAEIRTHIQGPSSPQNSPLDQGGWGSFPVATGLYVKWWQGTCAWYGHPGWTYFASGSSILKY